MSNPFSFPVVVPTCLALMLVLLPAFEAKAQSLNPASGDAEQRFSVPAATPAARGGGVTITHSASLAIESLRGVSCTTDVNEPPIYTFAQSFWRVFDLEGFSEVTEDFNFEITEVRFGIESADGTNLPQTSVNLHTLRGDFVRAHLTPVATANYQVNDADDLTVASVSFSNATVSASDVLVVEWAVPDGVNDFAIYPGANDAGESAPSYISSQACGLPEPVAYENVGNGFPGVHWVVTVTGNLVADTVPPSEPGGLTATAGAGAVSLSWDEVPNGDLDGYSVYRATAPFTTTGEATRLTPTPQDETTFTDDTVDQGTTYFYRVTASDDNGNESEVSNQVSISARMAQVSAAASFTFGDATAQQNYRLVALPGEVNVALATTLTGEREEDWRAFREGGASGGEQFSRPECTNSCQFRPGQGFWVLAANPWTVNQSIPVVDLATDGTYAISLRPGWNLISNPLEVNVPWQAVRDANGLDASVSLYRWSGAWQTTEAFASASRGGAFYMLNPDGRTSLKIPFQTSARPVPPPQPAAFELTLTARVGGEEVAVATVAEAADAVRGLDGRDRFAPPGYFEKVGLVVANDELGTGYDRLRRDTRPPSADGHEFTVSLTGEPGTTVELVPTFEGEIREAALVNPVSGERHRLRAGEVVRLRLASAEAQYELRVGTLDFVRAGTAVPVRVESGSYPNPFTSVTTLRYGLPEADRVRLTVYNLLGERVAVLLDGEAREAGYHAVVWKPDGLASGVYVYVLETGAQRLTGKLTVLR